MHIIAGLNLMHGVLCQLQVCPCQSPLWQHGVLGERGLAQPGGQHGTHCCSAALDVMLSHCAAVYVQLVRVIAERGLRSLAGKHPEASLTGALSREVLFTRLKPGTYALQVGRCINPVML